jgi:hypothetical protein
MRIANSTSDPLPYIMIRTAKGVTFQGIDGIEYLKQTSTDENPPTLQDST